MPWITSTTAPETNAIHQWETAQIPAMEAASGWMIGQAAAKRSREPSAQPNNPAVSGFGNEVFVPTELWIS